MRILHLAKFYPPAAGGIETHVQTLARAQARQGADVRVLCVNHLDAADRDITFDSFGATRTVETWDGDVRVTRVGRCASFARMDVCPELGTAFRSIPRDGYDVIHLHAPNPTMTLLLAMNGFRQPLVVTHHSDVVRQRLLGMAFRPVEHGILRRSAAILSTSPMYAGGSPLLQQYPDKLRVLPLGIDLEPFLNPSAMARSIADEVRREHGDPLWLAVGRLVYYKGFENALVALRDVPGKLILVGSGPLEKSLRQRAESLGVADRMVWKRRVSSVELCGLYHAASALWMPSNARSEGFGLVQVEAMASGCPVINSEIPHSGVSWVSPHEVAGLTTPMNDPRSLAAAARRLLDDAKLRPRLAAAARDRAVAEFDENLMAHRSLAIYRRQIWNHSPHRRFSSELGADPAWYALQHRKSASALTESALL